jgi:lipopolysaccharide export system permease protein
VHQPKYDARLPILDRSIARQFLTNAVLLMAFLMAMIVAVDFSLNFDEFVKQARLWIASGGAGEQALRDASGLRIGALAIWAVIDLWWPRLFLLFGYLLGPVLVGAMGFTCAYLVKQRELVAILASGQSLWRVARPMLLCTLALMALHAFNREFIIPDLAPRLTRDVKQRDAAALRDFTTDAQGRLLYLREIRVDPVKSSDAGEVRGFYAWDRDQAGLITSRVWADAARWTDGAWELTNGLRAPRGVLEDAGPGTRIAPRPLASLATDIDPTALKLRRFEGLATNLSTRQLTQLISRYEQMEPTPAIQRRINAYDRIRWGRVATLCATFLAVVVCLPFFLRKEPANMLTQSLYAAPVALGAFAATLVGTTATLPGLPPALGVFVPVLLLVPLAIASITSVRS